ncbi:hypothetical protein CVT26_010818 [Gymnopilus dilepis]|uniref:Phorbol-ester/DAG-type domain-containing protein n=1 Tax=Gymnopilus dilepis TaxID=231916 RepID=A0A409VIN3_9AGAR|nr:hypothetical protein CVT26_010818 [Gymnopilus dilepis]
MSNGQPNKGRLPHLDPSFSFNVYDDDALQPAPLSPSVTLNAAHFEPLSPSTNSPTTPKIDRPAIANVSSRARNESRKLLSHVLIQLANRRRPEPIVDTITKVTHDSADNIFGSLGESVRDAFKVSGRQASRQERHSNIAQDDSDDESTDIFTTDDTIDLMVQLLDVLTLSIAQGWPIFDERSVLLAECIRDGLVSQQNSVSPYSQEDFREREKDLKVPSPFRRPRSVSKRSRSPSPTPGHINVSGLLSLCIAVLKSVVLEDCRYRVASPRPSRPPNALQGLTLNVAQFIIHNHRHSPRIISQIAFAMVPAFYTFSPSMYTRLLLFFRSSVLNTVLKSLKHLRGPIAKSSLQSRPGMSKVLLYYAVYTSCISVENPFADSDNPEDNAGVSIQIDEVQADPTELRPGKNWESSNDRNIKGGVQSTNNPRQSPSLYYLAFLIPPLLTSMLESLDQSNTADRAGSDDTLPTQFLNLLELITRSKPDTYNDLLEIVAYRGAKPRRMAIAILCKIWPKSVGHTMISRPFCSVDGFMQTTSKPFAHQFMPWYFEAAGRVNPGYVLHDHCRSCFKGITGFGLLCPFCMTAVHFDCYEYPEGNLEIQYSMKQDAQVQRIAMCRFSNVQSYGLDTLPNNANGHKFEAANWFTLSLCSLCRKPLWGCFAQGLKCANCPCTLHRACVASFESSQRCRNYRIASDELTIFWDTLRLSCLDHFPVLRFGHAQLKDCTYEEVAIFHATLRTQLQILINGIEFGTVLIHEEHSTKEGRDQHLDRFELHQTISTCEELLASGRLTYSPLMQQYCLDSDTMDSMPSIMHNWSFLEYVTAAIKTSLPQTHDAPLTQSDLLTVDSFASADDDVESTTYPFETATVSHIRNILAVDFSLRSDYAAQLLINQLHHLSLLERVDSNVFPFEGIRHEMNVECVFPLPLGLDLSMNVETLVSSIEASLEDLDLSTNEFGFLLLTRRFWPNSLASEYGLRRLATKVLSWILNEDDHLATVLREFLAKKKLPPGVWTDHDSVWPHSSDAHTSSTAAANGSDYIPARRSLLSRFALPWLMELHNIHPPLYSEIVFDACLQSVQDPDVGAFDSLQLVTKDSDISDKVLRSIIKLCHASVVFDVFDELLARWIELLSTSHHFNQPIPSLPRLWPSDNDITQRTTLTDHLPGSFEKMSYINPLEACLNYAKQSSEALRKCLSFLSNVVKSGIYIPTASFRQLLGLIKTTLDDDLTNADKFARAVALSLWLRSFGRQDLQNLISSLHAHLSSRIHESLNSGKGASTAISIIRYSLAACLRLCGCERSSIIAAGMMTLEDVQQLPLRKRVGVRGSGIIDPVTIETEIMTALQLYVTTNLDEVSGLTAKFLNMFIMDSPFLEGFEVDNFILRNGKIIAQCAWMIYSIQRDDLATVRINLLLRSLLIDSEHFHNILRSSLDPGSSPMTERLSSVNRLFRMVADVTNPAFNVEGRQWRSSVSEIFYAFFSALWADDSEEVRTMVKSSVAALLPGHFEVISQCWNESLAKAPISERTRLVSFLLQLRPHFSSWKVLDWECIIDTLVQYDYDPKGIQSAIIRNNDMSVDKDTSPADPDLAYLRVSIILLSLQMMADGVEIDNFSLMKLKTQFVQVTGFSQISVAPTQNGQSFQLLFSDIIDLPDLAYPCIEELPRLVDAPHYSDLPYTALGVSDHSEDRTVKALIGSAFLDAVLCLLSTVKSLASLPVLTLKCLLDTLYIVIHKYDLDDRSLRHLQPVFRKALLRVVEILSTDMSYEVRQMSLSIAQAAINSRYSFIGPSVPVILELVVNEVASESRNLQDALVVHARLLIGNTFQSFCASGLLLSLMKRQLRSTFFKTLNQVLDPQSNFASNDICETLLRDTMARASAFDQCDSALFQHVVQNLSQFVEGVFFEGYSPELIIFIGQHLTSLARRLSDGSIAGADPSPLVDISTVVLQNHKKYAKEFLPYVDTLLRAALNRLHVNSPSLIRLLDVASAFQPKIHQESSTVFDVFNTLVEILADGLRMKTKALPLAIKCLADTLIQVVSNSPSYNGNFYKTINDGAYFFLQNHIWHEESIEQHYQAALASGKLLLLAASRDPAIFQRIRESRLPLSIRSWNILLLVTLQGAQADWMTMMHSAFPTFSVSFSAMLRSYVYSGISSSAGASTDVNQAHIAMKGWLTLVNTLSRQCSGGEDLVMSVWNELWPAYEGFLNVLETEAQAELHPQTLVSLVSTSVADLFLFIHSLKTPLALGTSFHILILHRLQLLNRGDTSSSKLSRAIRIINETPPEIASSAILMDQLAKELIAAEKIRLIESKRDNGRITGDSRYRKEGKLPTNIGQ